MADIILHQLNSVAVGLRQKDCYINATAMTTAHRIKTGQRKDVADWLRLKRTEETLEHLSSITGIPVIQLYQVIPGSPDNGGGTWIHPKLAVRFGIWLSDDFGFAIETWVQEWNKDKAESLENLLQQKPTIKEIDQVAEMFGRRFGQSYEARYVQQQIKKHYFALAGDEPTKEELPSLSARALLTPTELGVELGLLYSTGTGNARAVNKLLEDLGYQIKVSGQWSATDKAQGLCDRKPVDTNSRTQKDQLLWSVDIIPILQEYVTA